MTALIVAMALFFAAIIAAAVIMRPKPIVLPDDDTPEPALVDPKTDADRLLNEVRRLLAEFVAVRRLADVLSRRIEWLQPAAVIGVIVGLLGVGVGVTGLLVASSATHSADQANNAADQIVVARTNTQVNACLDYNNFAVNHNHLDDSMENVVRNAAAPNPNGPPRTAAQQALADKFVTDNIAVLETAKVSTRDCSPAAVALYYNHPPDPAATTMTTTTTTVPGSS